MSEIKDSTKDCIESSLSSNKKETNSCMEKQIVKTITPSSDSATSIQDSESSPTQKVDQETSGRTTNIKISSTRTNSVKSSSQTANSQLSQATMNKSRSTSAMNTKSVVLKRACEAAVTDTSDLPELSEASFMESMPAVAQGRDLVDERRSLKQVDFEESVICGAAAAAFVSSERKEVQLNINKLKQRVSERNAQICQFEGQYRVKLEAMKRLQQQNGELTQKLKETHDKKVERLQDSRCLASRNTKLSCDVNTTKASAQSAQDQLRQAVTNRLVLQQDLHDQGKKYTQEFDSLKSRLLEKTGNNRTSRQALVNLQQDVEVAAINLNRGADHLREMNATVEGKRLEIVDTNSQLDVLVLNIQRTRETLSKRQKQVQEISEGKAAGEKLLLDARQEAESHRRRGEVLEAGEEGKTDIVEFLQNEVKRLKGEIGQLQRTVAGREGQLNQLKAIVEFRKWQLETTAHALQQSRQTLQQLQLQYCSRLTAVSENNSGNSSSVCSQ